jgi:hypothetical protein
MQYYCSYRVCNETTTTNLSIIITITEKAAATKGLVAYTTVYPRPPQHYIPDTAGPFKGA